VRQQKYSNQKQRQRRERDVAGDRPERILCQRAQRDPFEHRLEHSFEPAGSRRRKLVQHDELEHERRPERHRQAAQQADAIRRRRRGVQEQHEEEDVEGQARQTRIRNHERDRLRSCRPQRHEDDDAVRVFERAARSAHEARRRKRVALHQYAHEQDTEHEREHGRRHECGSRTDSEAAKEHDRQKQERQTDRFASGVHLRSLNRRIGLKSDASTRIPASSSARSSSAE
jgi:hypothetical protein